ncbi:Lrp/AsnC family transcriptional regulator [uncultured Pigmentiphaga sp.]|uniref:Lrp/AsnC family transcriptional regulator n=1 Tax=uncultured Pigmentiphaga sp. TaxID=340361 RepID=UPI00263065DD|nr:Lrp/AsnC family transcriptional regulator [uncultured Pigmentiphaga sp.]
MDEIDHRLIALLRDNARTPASLLVRKLGVSRGTVQNRITRLEKEGVIVGYTLRLRPGVEPKGIRAWMSIAVGGNTARRVLEALRGEPAIQALHTTNGRWDILAELRAQNIEDFDRALERIRLIPGITSTETSILLSTYV